MPDTPLLDRRTFFRLGATARPRPAQGATLAPYVPSASAPWGPVQARHLLRRTGLGAREVDVQTVLDQSPTQAASLLVTAAAGRPLLAEPEWIDERKPRANAPSAERQEFFERNRSWIGQVYTQTYSRLLGDDLADPFERLGEGFRERMTVFWSNHFVADLRTHNIAVWLFHYRQTLRRHALGNVRTAVHDIGLTAAMLDYLNGNDNRAGAPNENYARELLELFTMGVEAPDGSPNYTQDDIVELARALTGWRTVKDTGPAVVFQPDRFDDSVKTILGQTGAFGYDDVVPLLFEQRRAEIASFIAGKLCRELVCDVPDSAFVAEAAQRLLDEDFELAPVVEAILQSAYFFEPEHVGALIRSPIELMLGSAFAFGRDVFEGSGLAFGNKTERMGQDLFNPPDVQGWVGGREWINTGTMGDRVKYGREQVRYAPEAFVPDTLRRPEAADPRELAGALCDELLAWPLPDDDIEDLTNDHLRDGVSEADAYWDPTSEDAERRLTRFLNHVVSLPAYQLR